MLLWGIVNSQNHKQEEEMKSNKIIFLILIVVLSAWAANAGAVDRYVSTTGTDSGGCTNALSPCGTIEYAASQAGDNDTIKVAEGIYYSQGIEIDYSISGLSFLGGFSTDFSTRSNDPALTVIDGSYPWNWGTFWLEVSNSVYIDVLIEGFTMTNGHGGVFASTFGGGSISLNLTNNVITDNHNDSNGGGVYIGVDIYGSVTAILVNNVIMNNSAQASGGGVYALAWDGNTSIAFVNNIITGNSANITGGGVYARAQQSGMLTLTFTNNTITDNSADFGGGIYARSFRESDATIDVINTILWGNTASTSGNDMYISEDDTSGQSSTVVNASYSDVGDVVIDPTYPGTYNDNGGNMNVDPNFVDPAPSGSDYHLRWDSLCIDTGDNSAINIPPIDFEGDPRIINGTVDIGADEYDMPIPDVKANGSDGPVIINQGDNLTVSIGLDPGSHAGENADWKIMMFYYYQPAGSFIPIMNTGFQSPLFNLPPVDLINTTGFPQGLFLFLFGVDMNPNDILDEPMYLDFVAAIIQ
jgi:hypothetical protein